MLQRREQFNQLTIFFPKLYASWSLLIKFCNEKDFDEDATDTTISSFQRYKVELKNVDIVNTSIGKIKVMADAEAYALHKETSV